MSALGLKLRKLEGDHIAFRCPGCKRAHHIVIRKPEGVRGWDFNGDLERPTFTPSIFVNAPGAYHVPHLPSCHSFVTDGQIQFLHDCTHELAGQTVDLPDWKIA